MEHAGEVVIEVNASTTGFDKKMQEIERRLDELDKKARQPHEYKGATITGGWNLTDEEQAEYEKLYEEYEKLYELDLQRSREQRQYIDNLRKEEASVDNIASLGDELTNGLTAELDKMLEEYRNIQQEFQKSGLITQNDLDRAEELKQKIRETAIEIEKMSGVKFIVKGINDTAEETKKVNLNLRSVDSSIKKIGNSLKKTIKNVVRWGLAIFGIRGAYMAVRNAMNVISEGDEKLKSDIDYMKTALAYSFEPIIRKIIDWIKVLVFYVAYLIKLWTGRDIFESANKSLQKSVGTAKELNKQLQTTSFDEMNVLSDNSSSGGGSGGIDNSIMDEWKNFEAPKWLDEFGKKVKKLGEIIKKHWKGIVVALIITGAALIGVAIYKFIKSITGVKEASDAIKGAGTSFTGFFDGLGKGIEAIAILGGLALVIASLTELITAFSESGLKLTDVIGLMATVLGTIVILMGAVALLGPSMTAGMLPFLAVVAGISAILLVMAATLPTILTAASDFITAIAPSLIQLLDTIGINIDRIITSLGTNLPPIINSVGNLFEKIFNGVAKVILSVGEAIVRIMNTAKELITTVLNAILNFINRLGPAINNFVDNVIRAVTKLINFLISGIEYMVNTLVIRAVNKMIEAINKIGEYAGVEIPTVRQVSIPRFVPKFAKGTILNAPGKGVPVGGYQGLAGEAGREAYLPLSDRQLLEELGSTIGRYVNINATIPVQIGNRLVMREIKRIKAEDDFAYNS